MICIFLYNLHMKWIYLSPHLDDAVMSCGGLIWEQVQAGLEVEVWTICAGEPPPQSFTDFAKELHTRWDLSAHEAIAARREEDIQAVTMLGADFHHFSIPDAIYRLHPRTGEPLYLDWEDITGGLNPGDEAYLHMAARTIGTRMNGEMILAAPLTVGNHVDHQFTRALAEMLGLPLRYYPDYPYTMQYAEEIPHLAPRGTRKETLPVSPQGIAAWQDSVAAYTSQISTFWGSIDEMKASIQEFYEQFGGAVFWRKKS